MCQLCFFIIALSGFFIWFNHTLQSQFKQNNELIKFDTDKEKYFTSVVIKEDRFVILKQFYNFSREVIFNMHNTWNVTRFMQNHFSGLKKVIKIAIDKSWYSD